MSHEKPVRSWGVSEQKIVGARQEWRCAHCNELLPPSYEVDHVKPLWEGGPDCVETNAEALCNNCHGVKTQRESIRRRDLYRARLKQAVLEAKENAPEEQPIIAEKSIRVDTWQQKEAFLVDNPFLLYAFVGDKK